MAQVIEVRFINPTNKEHIHQSFTLANSHKEAIDLAMDVFSGGTGTIKGIEGVEKGTFVPGGSGAWRYFYYCTVADDEYDREMIAVLFASYKEKE